MIDLIAIPTNYVVMPSPVLDESPQGYHLEQRLQVTVELAANEQQYTVEFRLGEGSEAPGTQQLDAWIDAAEPVHALCTGLTARPFLQKEGKSYGRRGKEVQIGEAKAALDSFVVFAGHSMAALAEAKPVEETLRQVRAAFKRNQREYRQRRNAERVAQMEAQLEERVRQMRERKAAEEAAKAQQANATAEAESAGANGRKR